VRRTLVCGSSYLLLAFVLWWHAWASGAGTHTLCGCGDPALFLWFFQWPATAVAHLENPFFSTAMFHPQGVNLLSQTSVMGMSVPLIPVTWLFGPVASLNVASTLAPALSALAMFVVLRRWVRWWPAAYVGGLLYGFSPAVLTSLQFAHLMTAAVMILPLILAALVEIVWRQRRSPLWGGVALGVLLFVQFFMSTEMLAIAAVATFFGLVALVGAGLVLDRARLIALAPHAAQGLAVGLGVGGALLALPVWFALDGPAHLSGLVWANVGALGGYDGASFVSANLEHGTRAVTELGGYQGRPLPSSGYLGWALLGVLAAGLVIWFRDRRLWFYGFVLALCVAFSLGERRGQWEPERLFSHLPVLENVIVQRFMLIGFLAVAVMLAVVLDHARYDLHRAPAIGIGASAALGVIGLAPMVATFAPALPFSMQPVVLPRWYTAVVPALPAGRVLLSYPAPFSGIQVSLAWQAVNRMAYSQAGGGGPQGVDTRAGSARAGFEDLARLAFGLTAPPPAPTPGVEAAVRHALEVWRVNTVVVAPQGTQEVLYQGHPAGYAAAFMTAVLGRLPRLEAGAWVWDDVRTADVPALDVSSAAFGACVAHVRYTTVATLRAPRCTERAAAPR